MLDKGELAAVVSMDLSKAFYVIDHDLLLAKLKAYGVGERRFVLFTGLLVRETAESQDWETVFQLERSVSWGQCSSIFHQRLVLLGNTM